MIHKTKARFYVFELKMQLNGRYKQNDNTLTSVEKNTNKKEYFYKMYQSNSVDISHDHANN